MAIAPDCWLWKYAVSPRMQIGVEEIKDADICSPKCNMQNIVVGRW